MKDRRAEKIKRHYNVLFNGKKFKVLNCIVSTDKTMLNVRTKVFGQYFPTETFVLAEIPNDEGSRYIWLEYAGMGSTTKMEEWRYNIVEKEEPDIEIVNNELEMRAQFKKRHTLSWERFQETHSDFIQSMLEKNHITFDEEKYEESYLWDLMPKEYSVVTFQEALNMLKEKDCKVLFMSEGNVKNSGPHHLTLHGENFSTFLAEFEAESLAELIEREWYESYRLTELHMHNPEAVLPEDLYVFDASLDWVIAFTHEITCDYDLEWEDPLKEAEYRLCITNLPLKHGNPAD